MALTLKWILVGVTALITICSAHQMYDYNAVNFVEFDNYYEFKQNFMYDNGRINQNVMLGIASPECRTMLDAPAFQGVQRHGGGNSIISAALPLQEFPHAIHGCAEVFFYKKGTLLAEPTDSITDLDHRSLNTWIAHKIRVPKLRVTNGFNFPIAVYWHEESMEAVYNGELQPGESFTMGSFLGHIFSANSLDEKYYFSNAAVIAAADSGISEENVDPGYLNLVDFFVVDSEEYTFSPNNRLETCELDAPHTADPASPKIDVLGEKHSLNCENMYLRLLEFTHHVWYEKRLGLNFVQPQLVETVTPTGFEHRKLPADTYDWLKQWYENQKQHYEVIESSSGPCMNQHVAPSGVTHLNDANKRRLSLELKPILEEWHGGKLDLTSVYGIRKYINGSVLRMHVDTVNTHVVSAIINVDQEVEEDWRLLILDHDDREHWIVMQPGDMVLYESAKLLHGRPEAFKGSHYDNIFIHYKPLSGWNYDWI